VDVNLAFDVFAVIAQCCPQLQELTIRCMDHKPLDTALASIAAALPALHTLAFVSPSSMTLRGVVAFAERCPSFRHLSLSFCTGHLDLAQVMLLAQQVPHLFINSPLFSVPKYACRSLTP
jgi:hypothetical protein